MSSDSSSILHKLSYPGGQGEKHPDLAQRNKDQGNNAAFGMDDGLARKASLQQDKSAERSRLKEAGLFENHLKHEVLVNRSDEHRSVASGAGSAQPTPTTFTASADPVSEPSGSSLFSSTAPLSYGPGSDAGSKAGAAIGQLGSQISQGLGFGSGQAKPDE